MKSQLRRLGRRLGALAGYALGHAAGALVTVILKAIRRADRIWISDAFARFMRKVGPWRREHRIGRAHVGAEFPPLARLTVGDPLNLPYLKFDSVSGARFDRLRDDGKPALVFAAHLANWELPAIMAAAFGLDAMVLYRRPNIGAIADAVIAIRHDSMGTLVPTDFDAPIRLS